jgi:thiaminase (transcriptional activator TenA)
MVALTKIPVRMTVDEFLKWDSDDGLRYELVDGEPRAMAPASTIHGLYLDWASRAPRPLPDNFVHAEWVTLHDSPGFRGFVDFLCAELDRVGPAQAELCRDFFRRAVVLELSFFEAAYADRT